MNSTDPYRIRLWALLSVFAIVAALLIRSAEFFVASGLALIVLLMLSVFNLGAFPIDYGVFGSGAKSPVPKSEPLFVVRPVGGMIGQLRVAGPFIRWSVYKEGIRLEILLIGSGFLPFSDIDSIAVTRWGRCRIDHHSPELRNPLWFPRGQAARRLVDLFECRQQ